MYQVSYPLRERLTTLRWALPLAFVALVFAYQWGPARWVHDNYTHDVHYVVEIVFYATVGPLVAFWTLSRIGHWLDEKDEAERQARASERRLATIIDASADAILSTAGDGRIVSWNHGAQLLFGYPAEEITGQPLTALFASERPAGVEWRWLQAAVSEAGFIRDHETVCRRADGRRADMELTATNLLDDHDQPAGMSIIMRDITARKQREAEIRRLNASLNEQVADRTHELAEKVGELAQANTELQKLDQMRSEFVSLVSHQIRAPLTNIGGAVERIRNDCVAINPTCVRMFAILEQQTARLDRLVSDVLNAARIESGQLVLHQEPMSLLPVVNQVTDQIRARASRRAIQVADKPGLPLVYADRDRAGEVLANLLDNADKYSPPGEPITIEVRADQEEVTVTVRDAGPGLPAESLERIFERFYRTDSSDAQAAYGYGLGLYVCRRLIEAQGGRIWAENQAAGGAAFSFALPVWQG